MIHKDEVGEEVAAVQGLSFPPSLSLSVRGRMNLYSLLPIDSR
jgi:hypothetical protein